MPPRKGSGKKARPSFGAARKAEPEAAASWVYRSEPEPAAPASPPVRKAPKPDKPDKPDKPTRAAETAVVVAMRETEAPGRASRLERAADWMMMPTALALVVVLVPVSWLMGSRRR